MSLDFNVINLTLFFIISCIWHIFKKCPYLIWNYVENGIKIFLPVTNKNKIFVRKRWKRKVAQTNVSFPQDVQCKDVTVYVKYTLETLYDTIQSSTSNKMFQNESGFILWDLNSRPSVFSDAYRFPYFLKFQVIDHKSILGNINIVLYHRYLFTISFVNKNKIQSFNLSIALNFKQIKLNNDRTWDLIILLIGFYDIEFVTNT